MEFIKVPYAFFVGSKKWQCDEKSNNKCHREESIHG